MRFSVLSSGSRANATFFESGSTRILIDCGLSAAKAAERLRRLGIDPDSIDAILVTHEHHDHIAGVPVFSRRHTVPVFANEATAEFIRKPVGLERFTTGEEFVVGDLRISPFRIAHDAQDPVGFRIEAEGLVFAQVTDLGRVSPLVREAVRGVHALVLESNHDPELLLSCDYPWELKQRISSSHGHLSNNTAAELLAEIRHPELWHVVLGHLSENSNTPEVALATLGQHVDPAGFHSVLCAGVAHETPMHEVGEREFRVALPG